MALKFRRGTTAQQSGSLAFGEPYVNTTLGTLVIGGASGDIILGTTGTGSTGTFGAISGSGLDITGNARIGGNLTLGGAITIGDATADTINVVASISSSLVPNDNNTFDIGSSSKIYRTIYGGIISGSVLEIMSGSNPELRLTNKATGIEYHIQNGDGGHFQIHNGTTNNLLFRFDSGSLQNGNQNAQFYGGLNVSQSLQSHTFNATHITGSSIRATQGFTGSFASTNGVVSGSSQVASFGYSTTGSNTFKGNQTIIGSGTGFAAYISTSVNDGTLGLDTTAAVNAAYFLKNGEKNFEVSYDTTNANGIFRLLPYDNSSYFEIGNPSNSANGNSDYVFISEATYGNILMGPGLGNATSFLGGATPLTDKVQIAGNLYVSGAVKANSFTGSIAATNGIVSGSSQVVGILSSLNTFSGSENTKSETLRLYTASVDTKFSTLATYTGSNDTTNTTQNTRLTRLEEATSSLNSLTGSYARTNTANVFTGNQTITGSLFISQDLVVQGSSSIQTISSSRLDIGDNIIQLNVNSPSLRFGGLAINDSGSAGSSGSFLYDSVEDEFIFVHKGNGTNVTSSHFVLGPETYDNLGNETYLTNNKIPKGSGKEHLNDSTITDTGTLITLGSNTVVNGTIVASGTTLVSASAQVVGILSSLNTYTGSNDTTNTTQNTRLTRIEESTSSLNAFSASENSKSATLQTYTASIDTKFTTLGTYTASVDTKFGNIQASTASLNTLTASLATTYEGRASASKTIFSGSSQVVGSSITTNTITIGSTSTALGGTSTTLAGLTSVSSTGFTGALTGNASTATTLQTARTINGTSFDGSANITIANLVSGSSQISIASTTGFGTYLNQGVLSTSDVRHNSLGIGMAASATAGRIDAAGDIVAFSTSDKNFKENITPIPNALEKISKISGNTYDWKADMKEYHGFEGNDVGVIAQEIEEVLPQLVTTRETGYKAVKYDKLVALLIEGIKEQQTQIHSLTLEIEKLKESKGL